MMVDIRKAGSGCIDNPVRILVDALEGAEEASILLRPDQEALVREVLDIMGFSVKEVRRGEHLLILARRDRSP